MNFKDRNIAEVVLNRLCVDAQIEGIRFGAVLQILISHNNPKGEKPIHGQVYLNLSSRWKVFDSRPVIFPSDEDELEEISQQEEIQIICELRERKIEQVELGKEQPHLILSLDDGKILFVNGKHDLYECWDIGIAFSSDVWQVIACPSGEVAISVPNGFSTSKIY